MAANLKKFERKCILLIQIEIVQWVIYRIRWQKNWRYENFIINIRTVSRKPGYYCFTLIMAATCFKYSIVSRYRLTRKDNVGNKRKKKQKMKYSLTRQLLRSFWTRYVSVFCVLLEGTSLVRAWNVHGIRTKYDKG